MSSDVIFATFAFFCSRIDSTMITTYVHHELRPSIGQCATLACLLEATAPKVGNVHRGADFEDLTFSDLAVSAVALCPAMEIAATAGVGQAVNDAVKATRTLVGTNTNLGIALLIAPLAAVPRSDRLTRQTVSIVLNKMGPDDCRLAYEAIRLAKPGGLGRVASMDVADEPPGSLLDAMQAAADRDQIAEQYVTNFFLVLDRLLPGLIAGRQKEWSLTDAIVHTHLTSIAQFGDSLIARKCGRDVSQRAATIASHVLEAGDPGDETYYAALADFDFWLRSDGHRRNPGATADLIAAALFVGLRDGLLPPPWR
jgi:triphosphoribosyl-dephospho-CoA synthase